MSAYYGGFIDPYSRMHFSKGFRDKYAARAAELRDEATDRQNFWALWVKKHGLRGISDKEAFLNAYYDKHFPEETKEV